MKVVKKARLAAVAAVVAGVLASVVGPQAPASAATVTTSAWGCDGILRAELRNGSVWLKGRTACPSPASVKVTIDVYICGYIGGKFICYWAETARSGFEDDGDVAVSRQPAACGHSGPFIGRYRAHYTAQFPNEPRRYWDSPVVESACS